MILSANLRSGNALETGMEMFKFTFLLMVGGVRVSFNAMFLDDVPLSTQRRVNDNF